MKTEQEISRKRLFLTDDDLVKQDLRKLKRWTNPFSKLFNSIGLFGFFVINLFVFFIFFQLMKVYALHHNKVLNGGNNLINMTILLLVDFFFMIIWERWKTREPQGIAGM